MPPKFYPLADVIDEAGSAASNSGEPFFSRVTAREATLAKPPATAVATRRDDDGGKKCRIFSRRRC
jgi:hypothetical protein